MFLQRRGNAKDRLMTQGLCTPRVQAAAETRQGDKDYAALPPTEPVTLWLILTKPLAV